MTRNLRELAHTTPCKPIIPSSKISKTRSGPTVARYKIDFVSGSTSPCTYSARSTSEYSGSNTIAWHRRSASPRVSASLRGPVHAQWPGSIPSWVAVIIRLSHSPPGPAHGRASLDALSPPLCENRIPTLASGPLGSTRSGAHDPVPIGQAQRRVLRSLRLLSAPPSPPL